MTHTSPMPLRLVFGFIAGFLGTVLFHQLCLALLWVLGIAPFAPFPVAPVPPFGVPMLLSLAFWGGVWGIVYALVDRHFARGGYWVLAFLFGAILPTLVAVFVVLPLKGAAPTGDFNPMALVTALLINGVWGLGTGLILRAFDEKFAGRDAATA